MLTPVFMIKHKDGSIISIDELLSFYDAYRVEAKEDFYLIPINGNLGNPILHVEDDLTAPMPTPIVIIVAPEQWENIKSSGNIIKEDSATIIPPEMKTALLDYLKNLNIK